MTAKKDDKPGLHHEHGAKKDDKPVHPHEQAKPGDKPGQPHQDQGAKKDAPPAQVHEEQATGPPDQVPGFYVEMKPPEQQPKTAEQKRHLAEVEVARAAAESPDREGAPPVVKLVPPAKEPDGNPPSQPPSAPVVPADPTPRFVHQNARAPEGLKRYKIRATNYPDQGPSRYVLAKDEAAAREHYIRATGIQAILDTAKASEAEVAKPILSVRPQPD